MKSSLIAMVVVAWAGYAAAAEDESLLSRPNLLVFVGDDVGGQDFGCYGNDAIHTPHIDALAQAGLRFTRAFLTTSSCSPTRISVLTGKFPHATGAEDLHMPLPEGQVFVSTYLKQRGYYTGHMQKTHYGPLGNAQFEWYSKDLEFSSFLDECGERPFFMWVGFTDAHRPYRPGAFDPPHDPAKVKVPPYLADTEETRADLALYYDEVARMDLHIGQMVAELKRRGKFENTLIVFFSDNGMPFPRAKGTAYDSGIATPLVMCWPDRIQAGTVHEGLTSVIDLAPTLLAAAGLETPADMQGSSILPVLSDPVNSPGRSAVFAERNWHNCDEHIRAVRTGQYKLIRNAYLELPYGNPSDLSSCPSWFSLLQRKEAGQLTPAQANMFAAPRPQLELYDVVADPFETTNLADRPQYAQVVDELSRELDNWIRQTGDFPPTKRRRADNTDRVTGVKFTSEIAPLRDE